MKKDPVTAVHWIVIILGVAVVILPFINIIEKEKTPGWVLGLIFLFCSMSVVSVAIKQMAKRIDELEKKLGLNQK